MYFSARTAGACRTPELRRITALFLLLAGELALARTGAAAAAQSVTARQLVRTVDSALAATAQAAEDPKGGLDRRHPGVASFWRALEGMRLRVAQIGAALERREGDFFALVDQGSTDLGVLRVAWARTGVRNETIAGGVRLASASYRLLRANFGREGLRHRQGGDLSEAERRQFQRIQRAERRFAASLQPLRERARRRGDAATVAELDRFRGEAERIATAPLVLETYLNALIAGGEMRGEWEANAPYMRQDAPEELAAADPIVQDLYVESDIGQVFTVDLGAAGSHLDRETEVPAGEEAAAAPGAVQLYQPAEGEAEPAAAAEIAGPVFATEEDAGAPLDGIESGPAEDLPESAAVEEDGIVEEEDLAEAETAGVEDARVVPAPGETPATPEAGKASPAPAEGKGPTKASPSEPAKPPAAVSPVSHLIG